MFVKLINIKLINNKTQCNESLWDILFFMDEKYSNLDIRAPFYVVWIVVSNMIHLYECLSMWTTLSLKNDGLSRKLVFRK